MPYCERCDVYYWTSRLQHAVDSNDDVHNPCVPCRLDFPTWLGLKEHWVQSPRHAYCQYCDDHFYDFGDLESHMESFHYYCSECKKVFVNDTGLHEHYRQSPKHHYCAPCRRLFISANNLNAVRFPLCLAFTSKANFVFQHMNSSVHRSKDVKCPFGCGGAFVSRSALVLHLENGKCSSGITRKEIDRYIHERDTHNVITDPARMIGGPSQDTIYIATERSWNGRCYECCLCHNEFRTLKALNSHLASPKHRDKIYLCRGPSCGTRFTTLSAFVQHVESDKCGVMKFKSVQNAMDQMFGQMGRLTMS